MWVTAAEFHWDPEELCRMGLRILCPQDRNRSIYPLAPSLTGQGLPHGVLAPCLFQVCACVRIIDQISATLGQKARDSPRCPGKVLPGRTWAPAWPVAVAMAGIQNGAPGEVRQPGRGVQYVYCIFSFAQCSKLYMLRSSG